MMKVNRDEVDYENYGGNIAPRPNTEFNNEIISEKEHRANLYDFSATRSKWVNKDLTGTSSFQSLSPGFQRTFLTARVFSLFYT